MDRPRELDQHAEIRTGHCHVPIGFALIDDVHHLLRTGHKTLSATLRGKERRTRSRGRMLDEVLMTMLLLQDNSLRSDLQCQQVNSLLTGEEDES